MEIFFENKIYFKSSNILKNLFFIANFCHFKLKLLIEKCELEKFSLNLIQQKNDIEIEFFCAFPVMLMLSWSFLSYKKLFINLFWRSFKITNMNRLYWNPKSKSFKIWKSDRCYDRIKFWPYLDHWLVFILKVSELH